MTAHQTALEFFSQNRYRFDKFENLGRTPSESDLSNFKSNVAKSRYPHDFRIFNVHAGHLLELQLRFSNLREKIIILFVSWKFQRVYISIFVRFKEKQ